MSVLWNFVQLSVLKFRSLRQASQPHFAVYMYLQAMYTSRSQIQNFKSNFQCRLLQPTKNTLSVNLIDSVFFVGINLTLAVAGLAITTMPYHLPDSLGQAPL